ncbi:hypothetical protein E2C01_013538 [Portunus trituberculatus]|uniref:Uncharacterized protein n=1 Tax=Portunus trituberculatus TaxID=210409 RepID=A0A5B7DHA9_PORTR|nr:hypothetical protein [Portunus trituberculatus]
MEYDIPHLTHNNTLDCDFENLEIFKVQRALHQSRWKFFQRMWNERRHMVDDPWVHAVNLIRNTNVTTSRYIDALIRDKVEDVNVGKESVKRAIENSTSSRRVTYHLLWRLM